jgi:hypothetical protein
MSKPRHSNPGFMAKVLAETVADLSNPDTCRRHLEFAGFTPKQIDKHMANARNMARHLRINEIELRVRKELEL